MMLTAKGEESDIVTGLELGACDYITKPFSPKILAARMKAAMRKTSPDPSPTELPVKIHSISIDPKKFEVEIKGKKTDLTATEFRLLYLLAKNPGRVFTRSQIVSSVHGDDYPATDRSVDVQVVGLRKKLGDRAGRFIETVRGVGYRMREDK
jgi:two-component system phosphate regulon response regulator PhoB